ncbi:MAG: hypothetical protein K2L55_00915 [Muribaculaceae bacterium]|nr:hypothetical protein [Muribaculaceae bacterium]MDE6345213.1 hypothetical protein [Muribaculaceae bacterium]
MNQQQYKLGWQIACWSTLAIAVFSLLSIVSSVFGIISSLAVGAIGYGFFTAANELTKAGNPAATEMKAAATTLFMVTAINIIGMIIKVAVNPNSVSGFSFIIVLASLFVIAAAILIIMFKNKIAVALRHLNLENSLFGPGILVYAIGCILVGFGFFLFGISPSVSTLGTLGVLTVIGGIAALVGAILWIIGMFQLTEKATK